MRSLREIYEECRGIGLAESQRDFSALWGRAESWFSSAMTRENERRISTEALLGFYMALTDNQITNSPKHGGVGMLRSEVWSELMRRVGR